MASEAPSFIPGTKKEIRALKIKFYFILVVSNLLIFIATSRNSTPVAAVKTQLVHERPGHTKLKLAVDLKLEIGASTRPTPISLFDHKKQLVVALAYLHPRPNEHKEAEAFLRAEDLKHYQVEVPDSELKKIINHADGIFSAYPYNSNFKTIPPTRTRRAPYEIQF